MQSVEAEGNSIDAAITVALERLGATRDRVDIEILANASRGFLGLGGRKARVRATWRAPLSAESIEPAAPAAAQMPDTPAPIAAPPPPRAPAAASARTPARAPAAVRAPAPAPAASSPAAPIDDAVGERAARIIEEIAGHLGVATNVVLRRENDHLVLDLTGDSSGVLIGRRGQMLDALEYLINRIVGRDEGTSRLRVDSENYRARRRTSLEDMARRMGEQAKRKGRAVTLNPMSPQDRRIVHLILQEDSALTTKSAGKGYFRRLVIVPDGAARTGQSGRAGDR